MKRLQEALGLIQIECQSQFQIDSQTLTHLPAYGTSQANNHPFANHFAIDHEAPALLVKSVEFSEF
jgi:hypothetical protein